MRQTVFSVLIGAGIQSRGIDQQQLGKPFQKRVIVFNPQPGNSSEIQASAQLAETKPLEVSTAPGENNVFSPCQLDGDNRAFVQPRRKNPAVKQGVEQCAFSRMVGAQQLHRYGKGLHFLQQPPFLLCGNPMVFCDSGQGAKPFLQRRHEIFSLPKICFHYSRRWAVNPSFVRLSARTEASADRWQTAG